MGFELRLSGLPLQPLDGLELTLGAQVFVGPYLSTFGRREPLGFVFAEVFL